MGRKNRQPWFCQDCRVQMVYINKLDMHFCPKCKVRVYHSNDDDYYEDEIISLMRDLHKTHLPKKDPIPAGHALLGGGGSKSKGRSREGDMKKKTLSQINAGLAGKNVDFLTR